MSSVPSAPEGSADTASSDSGQPRQLVDEATMDSINKVAVDNAAEEYAASAAEYAQNGWHYEGTSTVVGSPQSCRRNLPGQACTIRRGVSGFPPKSRPKTARVGNSRAEANGLSIYIRWSNLTARGK